MRNIVKNHVNFPTPDKTDTERTKWTIGVLPVQMLYFLSH